MAYSTTITPYDLLVASNPDPDNPPTTGGTWTYTGIGSTGAAPFPPAAPGTYNGTLAFAGVDPGDYEYTYTVTSGSCTHSAAVTITKASFTPVANDTCLTARNMAFPYSGGCSEFTEQNLTYECPGQDEPTYDAISTPAAWGSYTYDSDLWYKYTFDPANAPGGIVPNAMAVTVNGADYGAEGITNPVIAVYTTCSAGSLVQADVAPGGSQTVSTVLSGIFGTSFTHYIRVSAPDGQEGKFTISITT